MSTSNPPRRRALRMYGGPSTAGDIEWPWVEAQLADAGTYWLVPRSSPPELPHPRPVWGVWRSPRLYVSIGSEVLNRQLDSDPHVTAHLDSAADVVIVEGAATGRTSDAGLIADYDAKYTWKYSVEGLGPLTVIEVERVIAWQSAGWAGRDGFQGTGRWDL